MPTLLYVPRFDESGAGPRYRVYQYFDSLKQSGFEITVKPLLTHHYLKMLYFKNRRPKILLLHAYITRALFLIFNKSKFDVVLMDGELFPFLPFFFEKLFLAKRFVVDQDDAIFHTYDQHRFAWVRWLLGNKIKKIWKRSQHVILCSNYVKEKVLAMGISQVSVLPTVVSANVYKPNGTPQRKFSDKTVIGWVGSPATVFFLDHLRDALIHVAQQQDIVLYVIGARYQLPGVETYCVDWKTGWNEAEEIRLTNDIDIGIMPLLDEPYFRGKGGFKLIKYMACEKPMIASPVGINDTILDHGYNGYLALDIEEWKKYLLMLIGDMEKCRRFGEYGRKKMIEHYSLEATRQIFCNILLSAT